MTMRRHWLAAGGTGIALALVLSAPAIPRAQAPAGDREKPEAPSPPTPRRPDGSVNLGAVPGGKGFWNNGLGSLIRTGDRSLPTNLTLEEVPFRPWAKALYEFR